jgi:large subunit ribosomal protein L1
MNINEALKELKKEENKRKFEQSIDLIVNLKGIDPKKDNISMIVNIPHKIKEKKICGFLTKKSELVHTITQPEFVNFKDKKNLKSLVKQYDFFIAAAKLMPAVATTFGKALGPSGKMPSPQLGVLMQEDDNAIKQLVERISKSIKLRVKEASIKVSVGKENMSDKSLIENIEAVYQGIVNALPTKKENVRNVMIKTTMSKALKVEVK